MKHAFISHASKDHETALKIRRLLESRGITCWIAPDDIVAGRDYGEEIIRGLEQTVTTVLLLSENSNASPFVKREIERAVSKGKPVLPVRIQNVLPSPGLEFFISSSHWIDAWQNSIDSKIDELAAAIRGRLDTPDAALTPAVETQANVAPSPPSLPRRPARPLWQYATGVTVCAALVAAALFFTMGTPPDKKLPGAERVSQPAQVKEIQAPAPAPTVSRSPAPPAPLQPAAIAPAGDALVPARPTAPAIVPSAKQAIAVEKPKPVRARSSARDTADTARVPHVSTTAAVGSCTNALQRASLGEPLSNEEKTLLRTKC